VTGYDRDVRSDGGQPTRLTRLAGHALAIVALTVLLGAAPSSTVVPGTIRQLIDAPTQGAGSTGLDAFGLLLLGGLAIAVVVALVAGFVLFRTRGAKAIPPPSEGWWTCPKCGAGNMDGAARCHACATWRTSTPHPTASPTP
jgi:hypothetical protein